MPKRKRRGKSFDRRKLAAEAFHRSELRAAKQPRISDLLLFTGMYLAKQTDKDIYLAQLIALGLKRQAYNLKKKVDDMERTVQEDIEVEQTASMLEKF